MESLSVTQQLHMVSELNNPTCAEVAKYVPPHKRTKYIPPQLREAAATLQAFPQTAALVVALKTQEDLEGRPSKLLSDGRTQSESECSAASTDFGDSETGDNDNGSTCSSCSESPRGRCAVRFSTFVEVHIVERQWDNEDACWFRSARRRTTRFRLRVHCDRLCSNAGCTCEKAGGLCSLGGELAKELEIGVGDIFAAWRCQAAIPATVSNECLKRGLTWGMRRH